jgi:hypothetical protein
MHPTARDVLVAAMGALVLVGYSAFLVHHLPMGITRLLISLGLVLLIGFVAGALMRGSLSARVAVIVIIPLAHVLYEGIDGAKPTISVIWYAAELVLLCIGLLVARVVLLRRHGTSARAA